MNDQGKLYKSQRKEKHFELGGQGIPDKRNITLKGIELQISMVCSEYTTVYGVRWKRLSDY